MNPSLQRTRALCDYRILFSSAQEACQLWQVLLSHSWSIVCRLAHNTSRPARTFRVAASGIEIPLGTTLRVGLQGANSKTWLWVKHNTRTARRTYLACQRFVFLANTYVRLKHADGGMQIVTVEPSSATLQPDSNGHAVHDAHQIWIPFLALLEILSKCSPISFFWSLIGIGHLQVYRSLSGSASFVKQQTPKNDKPRTWTPVMQACSTENAWWDHSERVRWEHTLQCELSGCWKTADR